MIATFREHRNKHLCFQEDTTLSEGHYQYIFPKGRNQMPCFTLRANTAGQAGYLLDTHYFIGVDWLDASYQKAIYVEPKLNDHNNQEKETDFTKMLFHCLKHAETAKHIKDLYVIKWEEKEIEISQSQDLLTPFLLTEFLGVLRRIVRKGLKKSYYKVERKLNGRIKGKIQVAKTVKYHAAKQRVLENICTFDVFGIDNQENKILKKALLFVKRYLPQYFNVNEIGYLQESLNFISPAFEKVSSDISIRDIKSFKSNAFFKEYDEGLRLAKLILKRFGYNISKKADEPIKTPPFWIDMSALFEYYVLSLLKDRFGNKVIYHFSTYGNELDYLLNVDNEDEKKRYKMVIDAKYKPQYEEKTVHQDIRQVSGYARLTTVQKALGYEKSQLVDCLIIYPNQIDGNDTLDKVDLKGTAIERYEDIYKLSVRLPTKNHKST